MWRAIRKTSSCRFSITTGTSMATRERKKTSPKLFWRIKSCMRLSTTTSWTSGNFATNPTFYFFTTKTWRAASMEQWKRWWSFWAKPIRKNKSTNCASISRSIPCAPTRLAITTGWSRRPKAWAAAKLQTEISDSSGKAKLEASRKNFLRKCIKSLRSSSRTFLFRKTIFLTEFKSLRAKF